MVWFKNQFNRLFSRNHPRMDESTCTVDDEIVVINGAEEELPAGFSANDPADHNGIQVNDEESSATGHIVPDNMGGIVEHGSVAETPVVVHSIGKYSSDEERPVAMSNVPDTMPKTNLANSRLDNVSVDKDKDTLTKFIQENPEVVLEEKIPEDPVKKIPEFNVPQEISVYSAAPAMMSYPDLVRRIEMPTVTPDLVAKKVVEDVELKVKTVESKKVNEEEPPPPPRVHVHSIPDQKPSLIERQVKNRADGYSFKVCDMNRLRRYIVLGSEHNTYHSTPGQSPNLSNSMQNTLDNIKCVKSLLSQNRHEEIIETITDYSMSGRVAKEEPILSVLALCAGHEKLEVRKAAFRNVCKICNIPTKLFRFLELTQDNVCMQRKKNLPSPQKSKSKKQRSGIEPAKKKKEKSVFKKVNADEKKSSGWGRMRRKSVGNFYADEEKGAARLLYLVTKYKQRHNWSHKTVIGYSHPKMVGENAEAKNLVMKYCTGGYAKIEKECTELVKKPGVSEDISEIINYINVIEKINKLNPATDEEELLEILKLYAKRDVAKEFATATTVDKDEPVKNTEGRLSAIHIVREHLPTGFLKSKRVWEALLRDMPMTALIRNLGKMSQMGLFSDPKNVETAVSSLINVHKLKTARIHPMKVLIAMKIYALGKGSKGELEWPVNQDIVEALDKAFYLSFKQPEVKENFKTNKNYMLCLDVSGSMTFRGCVGCELMTPAMASAAMAWVTWNVEDNVELVAFGGTLVDMKERGFTKDMLITKVLQETRKIRFGSTDCSLPMIHALQKRLEIDVFIVYTDSDTWAGRVQPVTALRNYNRAMNRVAKLIVIGMESTGFTIADPQDPNMMDIVGFDANVPELVCEFAKGNLSGTCSGKCADCRIKIESR